MYCGKRNDLENMRVTGDYYSLWLECETFNGEGLHPDQIESEIEGDAFDNWEEARIAAEENFKHTGVFEDFLEGNPDIAWVAVTIEKNEFVDGVDKGFDNPCYAVMLDRTDGSSIWSFQDEQGEVSYEEF